MQKRVEKLDEGEKLHRKQGFFFLPYEGVFLYILMNIESMEASYQSPVIGRMSIGQMDKDVKK